MKLSSAVVPWLLLTSAPPSLHGASGAETSACPATLDHELRRLNSDERVNLCRACPGRVVLIVNTASKCGCTPRYEAPGTPYERCRGRRPVGLGFPSNDFSGQEPGSPITFPDAGADRPPPIPTCRAGIPSVKTDGGGATGAPRTPG